MHHVAMASRKNWKPGSFLALDVLYVAILVVLLVGRQAHWLWIDRIHNPIGGIIPLAVPWFGALGAVTISIYGVVGHSSDWQAKWNLWHVIRPVVGAILGTVAYLIFIGVIQATGTTPSATGSSASVKLITYLVIAFVVGFREETFRTLIMRVVDILLSPGDTKTAPAVSISPSPVDFGSFPVNQSTAVAVTVTNTGAATLVVQGAGATPPGTAISGAEFTLSNDAVAGATINPKAAALVTVSFTPTAAGLQQGILTINSNAGTFPVSLSGTGTA